ncbi:uncharacterized protein BP01DRAFT_303693 [Aspergillus saccharolyticus JOP 1030-1]|uniref:Tetratricopeptide repeat protein 1 n=1 Tax=Aspergillus saccharolyticus JOP 1030-1 TaxID=1450539 RepID=A0A319A4E7_9EURO|nr:hypothetical protein BP01DRAFT_303693 [Aspergillus saccharolyticus JOP 1030-1]PYH42312.1 hypothetical protein BP01DRAFT_303693 [Aspergillus saccharolyticus JOP 1030-1]
MTNDANKHNPNDSDDDEGDVFHDARFPADEETRLLAESQTLKATANKLFSAASYDEAITSYDRALASCPNYLDYEVAVLRSNMAACYLKLEDWKASVDAATACLDRLDKVLPRTPVPKKDEGLKESGTNTKTTEEAVVEITGDDDSEEEEQLQRLQQRDQLTRDVLRIRAKALMRRARARMQLGGWANLQGAEEDYKELAAMDNLPPDDRRVVQRGLRELPDKINKAREKDMAEMMGKLKDLGNGILKPFGLSTDNFKFVQDPKTGGYSMNFQSG